jgi:hypothetical protein
MADEITLRKDVERKAQAEALLRNDMLTGAFDTLEANYIAAWKATMARDTDARERFWLAVNQIGKVREALAQIVTTGTISQADLARMTEPPKP